MKTDKLLFGAACLGMGFIMNSVINKGSCEPLVRQDPKTHILTDSIAFPKALEKDTLSLSNIANSSKLKVIKAVK